ncbi:class I SAM-dependent methyltransferase [Enterococcus faecalis]
MTISNETRFAGKAADYTKFRPSYPKELLDYLYTSVGLQKSSQIADIGAGTGIFSQLLLERDSAVIGVEPNDEMRKIAEQQLSQYQNFKLIKATAEKTDLANQSIDFVTVAQAFHWFDRKCFKQECQRILKPNGQVIIVWNTRDYESNVMQAEHKLREKYAPDKKGANDSSRFAKAWWDFFSEGLCEYKTCRNDLALGRAAYLGLNLSRSWSPRKTVDPTRYEEFVEETNQLFDKYSSAGQLLFPNFVQCYSGKVK